MPGHVGGEPVPAHELVLPKEFWDLIQHGDDLQKDCWLWGGLQYGKSGYGRWNQHNWGYWVHRITFAQYRGEIPEGLVIDHLCMNKICCNPYHLDPTTTQDNIRRWSEQTIQVCKRGHPRTKANTSTSGNRCKICHREKERERQRKIKEGKGYVVRTGKIGRPINTKTKLGYVISLSGLKFDQVCALSGVYRSALTQYVSGKADIPIRHLVPLCTLFDCDPEDLIGFRYPQEPPADPSRDRSRDRGAPGDTGGSDGVLRPSQDSGSPVGSDLPDRLRQGDAAAGLIVNEADRGDERSPSDRQL